MDTRSGNSRSASAYPQLRNAPSVNFMMLPLWTRVRLRRLLATAYPIAARISRSVPSRETGFSPMLDVSGKRIFLYICGKVSLRNASTFFTSSEACSNSMPA